MPPYVKPKRSRAEIETLVAHMPLIDVDPRTDTGYFARVASKKLMIEYGLTGSEPDFLDQLGVQLVANFIDGSHITIAHQPPVTPEPAYTRPKLKPIVIHQEEEEVEEIGYISPADDETEDVAAHSPPTVPQATNPEPPHAPAPKWPEIHEPDAVREGPPWLKRLWNLYTKENRWRFTGPIQRTVRQGEGQGIAVWLDFRFITAKSLVKNNGANHLFKGIRDDDEALIPPHVLAIKPTKSPTDEVWDNSHTFSVSRETYQLDIKNKT